MFNVLDLFLQRTLSEDNVISFSSKVLSSLFALGKSLCDEKFELRVDNVRFVGHGVSLEFQVQCVLDTRLFTHTGSVKRDTFIIGN